MIVVLKWYIQGCFSRKSWGEEMAGDLKGTKDMVNTLGEIPCNVFLV